jgi:hypothetical protein
MYPVGDFALGRTVCLAKTRAGLNAIEISHIQAGNQIA